MTDYLRKSSEAFILLMVAVSPWAFGCVHPFFRYCLTGGIVAVFCLWAIELFLTPPTGVFTKFQLPVAGLVLIVLLQLVPLGPLLSLISPESLRMQRALYPNSPEQLADHEVTSGVSAMSAQGRVSLYPAETLRRLFWLTQMALLFTRVQQLATLGSLRSLCYVCLVNGSLLAYFAIVQNFTSKMGVIYWRYPSLGAAFGPFINRNHFAFYMNVCIGLSLGLLGARQFGKYPKWTFENLVAGLKDYVSLSMLSVLVFMFASVVLCSSRAGLVSLATAPLAIAIVVSSTRSFAQGWKWFGGAAVVLGVAAALQISLGFDFANSHYVDTESGRPEEWWELLPLVPRFILVGTGYGTLPYIEPSMRTTWIQDHFLEHAHSEYLHLLIETGPLGLVCGLSLIFLLAIRIVRRIRSSRKNTALYVGLFMVLCTASLHSLAEFALAVPAVALLVVVVMGHVAGIDPRGEIVGLSPELVEPAKKRSSSKTRFFLAGPCMAIGLLVFSVAALAHAKVMDLAERSRLSAQRALRDGNLQAELKHAIDAARYSPFDAELVIDSARLRLAVLLDGPHAQVPVSNAQMASLVQAQRDLVAVRDMSPLMADAHVLLARYRDSFASADAVLDYYLRAALVRPADPTLAFLLGRTYLDLGQMEMVPQQFRTSLLGSAEHVDEILTLSREHFGVEKLEQEILPENASVLANVATRYAVAHPEDTEFPKRLLARAVPLVKIDAKRPALSYLEIARLHARLGETDASRTAYLRTLKYEPDLLNVRFELAQMLYTAKEFALAKEEYRAILRLKPGDTNAKAMLASISDLTADK